MSECKTCIALQSLRGECNKLRAENERLKEENANLKEDIEWTRHKLAEAQGDERQ